MVAFPEPTVPLNPALFQQAPLPTPAPTLVNRALAHALEARQASFSYPDFSYPALDSNCIVSLRVKARGAPGLGAEDAVYSSSAG